MAAWIPTKVWWQWQKMVKLYCHYISLLSNNDDGLGKNVIWFELKVMWNDITWIWFTEFRCITYVSNIEVELVAKRLSSKRIGSLSWGTSYDLMQCYSFSLTQSLAIQMVGCQWNPLAPLPEASPHSALHLNSGDAMRRVPSQGLIAVILAPKHVVRFICACSNRFCWSGEYPKAQTIARTGTQWKNMENHGKTWKNLHMLHTNHIPTVPTWIKQIKGDYPWPILWGPQRFVSGGTSKNWATALHRAGFKDSWDPELI